MNIEFKNKTVLVTAGSKGIGFELVKQFLIENANVCICSRNQKNLDTAQKTLLKFCDPKKLLIIKHDISNIKGHIKVIKKIRKKFKKDIDILINNSGGPPPKEAIHANLTDWKKALNTNLLSAVSFSKIVINNMKKNKWGRIINLTSTTAKEPAKNMVLSNVTRAALASFSKTLSLEVADYGITVNTILTGGCMTDRFLGLVKKNTKTKKEFKNNLKNIISQTTMQRIAEPEEFVKLIIFLASEYSSYINGTAIAIDGGSSKSIF